MQTAFTMICFWDTKLLPQLTEHSSGITLLFSTSVWILLSSFWNGLGEIHFSY